MSKEEKDIKEFLEDLECIESEVFTSTNALYKSREKWKKRLRER